MPDTPEPKLPATFTEGNHNPRLSRSDCHMLFSAIKNHWEIPPAIFKVIPVVLANLIANPAVDPRSKTQAVRNFIEMFKQNRETAQALGVIGNLNGEPAGMQDNTFHVKVTVVKSREEALALAKPRPVLAPPVADTLPDLANGI